MSGENNLEWFKTSESVLAVGILLATIAHGSTHRNVGEWAAWANLKRTHLAQQPHQQTQQHINMPDLSLVEVCCYMCHDQQKWKVARAVATAQATPNPRPYTSAT
jgi:hypothetical protein